MFDEGVKCCERSVHTRRSDFSVRDGLSLLWLVLSETGFAT